MAPKSVRVRACAKASGHPGSLRSAVGMQMPMGPIKVEMKDEEDGDAGVVGAASARSSSVRLKKRSCTSSTTGTPRGKRPKVEDFDGNDIGPSDGGDGDLGDEPAECSGCYRSSARDSSFTLAGADIEFQYISRTACWCKDCHTVWRLQYKARLTLTLLLRYLSSWPKRLQFLKELIALLSLRVENHARATAPVLQARVETLNFVFELLNIPWPLFTVRPLAEVLWSLGLFRLAVSRGDSRGSCLA